MNKGTSKAEKKQDSQELENRCWEFLRSLLEQLHLLVDRRIVKTFLDLVMVILMHRNRNNGLLLSELGDHLLGGERGPAGVKRIASLLHSKKWGSTLILKYLWKRANEKVQELIEQKEAAYVIWDESVLEKPESLKAEGLCAVRLKRIKPGYFNPPTNRPIFVPGFNWLQLLVTGLKGVPMLAHLCWWTTRGEKASQKREEEGKILKKVAKLWARKVIHIWDRGFAGSPWTTLALDHHLRFILRWNKNYHRVGPAGRKHEVWKISRSKRSWEYRMIWDARRWQIEMSLRFTTSEMAFESPRLIQWESRLKFLLIASLAYAFLLSLLPQTDFLMPLISRYCHRTGKWSREISAPLYRLRLALSRLWLDVRPHSLPTLISG